jgi:hypothetical protein
VLRTIPVPIRLPLRGLDLLSVRMLRKFLLYTRLLDLLPVSILCTFFLHADLLDLLSVRVLRTFLLYTRLLSLVEISVRLLSLSAPDVCLLDLVPLRFTPFGLALPLGGRSVLPLGGFLPGALEGASVLVDVGVVGEVGVEDVAVFRVGLAVLVVAVVGVVVAAMVVAASVAGLVHGCLVGWGIGGGGGWIRYRIGWR